MTAATMLQDNVEYLPVKLRLTDLAPIKIGGNMPGFWSVKTHATKDEILTPGWWDVAGHLLRVDDTLNVFYGPHEFDCDMAAENKVLYKGGAKPHERLSLYVISKEPKRNERTGRIISWTIEVRLD